MGTTTHARVACLVVWWIWTVSVQGLNGPTACTDLAIGAYADTAGPNTVSECVSRLAKGGVRENASNVEFDIDTGQRLFDWTLLRVRKSGKALRPYHCGPQAAAHRSERYRNYIPQADVPDWEVNASAARGGDVGNRRVATMEDETWGREKDSMEPTGFQSSMNSLSNSRDTSLGGERVRKVPSVSTSRATKATSLEEGALPSIRHDDNGQGKNEQRQLSSGRRAQHTPTTRQRQDKTQDTQVAGLQEPSDQAHTLSTPLLHIERGRPAGLTETNNADLPSLTTRQHSVVSEGPVDKGNTQTKTHVEISDPSSDVSGQSQEHQQAAGRERKQEKETETETKKEREEAREEKEVSKETQREKEKEQQRRGLKHRGGPNLAQFLYGALEGKRTKHQRRHKDKTDQGSGLSVGFH